MPVGPKSRPPKNLDAAPVRRDLQIGRLHVTLLQTQLASVIENQFETFGVGFEVQAR
jgi:hypothetical protein